MNTKNKASLTGQEFKAACIRLKIGPGACIPCGDPPNIRMEELEQYAEQRNANLLRAWSNDATG